MGAPRLAPQEDGGAAAEQNGALDGALDCLAGDASKLTLPIKQLKEKYELLPAFLKVGHHQLAPCSLVTLSGSPLYPPKIAV